MLPRHPRSTLFPYTTLFRSGESRRVRVIRAVSKTHREASIIPLNEKNGFASIEIYDGLISQSKQNHSSQDRKSTRLNSSHQIISYAVFCLKKKNKGTYRI